MPDWPFGGKPKTGAPTWFTYDEADVGVALPPLAGWIALTALGIPSGPQNTADFCSQMPPTEFSSPADIAIYGFPPLAIASGAYGRLGNQIKARKWSTLCDLSQGPNNGLGGTPPSGYDVYYENQSITWDPGDHSTIPWVGDQFPINTIAVGFRIISFTGNYDNLYWFVLKGDPHVGDPRPLGIDSRKGLTQNANSDPIGTWEIEPMNSADLGLAVWPCIWSVDPGGTPVTAVISIAWKPAAISAPAAPAPMPAIPDYPTSGGPCDAPSMTDLCKSLKDLHDKVDVLTRNVGPPANPYEGPSVKPDPVLPLPTDPGAPKPLHPVVKPAAAVGVILRVDTIPDIYARYGTAPTFYPAIGHVALLTKDGPLPSQLLKHSPMVIEPLPPYITAVQLDLEAGVEGSVAWLYPPTDPPPPVA